MADLLRIEIRDGKGFVEGNLNNVFDMAKAKHLLREAVDDMADAVEDEAKRQAPEGPSGKLKLHPVDREDTRIDITPDFFRSGFGTQTGVPAFGGGTSVRGPGGRFIKPQLFSPAVFIPGGIVAKSVITVAQEPKHAIWVHDGTGIHGPRKQMITAHNAEGFMTFPASRWPTARFRRKDYRFKSVEGQAPNPYLERAFLLVDRTYIPARIQILRAQIAAVT